MLKIGLWLRKNLLIKKSELGIMNNELWIIDYESLQLYPLRIIPNS